MFDQMRRGDLGCTSKLRKNLMAQGSTEACDLSIFDDRACASMNTDE